MLKKQRYETFLWSFPKLKKLLKSNIISAQAIGTLNGWNSMCGVQHLNMFQDCFFYNYYYDFDEEGLLLGKDSYT